MTKLLLSFLSLLSLSFHTIQSLAQSKFYVVKDNVVVFSCDGVPDYVTFSEDDLPVRFGFTGVKRFSGTIAEPVDLGLTSGTRWASHNFGASSAYEMGDYFAWGEVTTKQSYNWTSYQYMDHTQDCWKGCNKYTVDDKTPGSWYDSSGSFIGDGLAELDPDDDVASHFWGGEWRIPSHDQQVELVNECYWVWTSSYSDHNVNGYIVYKAKDPTHKGQKTFFGGTPLDGYDVSTDAHIFLPATGYRWDSCFYYVGSYGFYWSRSLRLSDSSDAWGCDFGAGRVIPINSYDRANGFSVRPVQVSK